MARKISFPNESDQLYSEWLASLANVEFPTNINILQFFSPQMFCQVGKPSTY